MVMISDFPNHRPALVEGNFQLQEIERVEKCGLSDINAVLADSSGTIRCRKWPDKYSIKPFLNHHFYCRLLLDQWSNRFTDVRLLATEPAQRANKRPNGKQNTLSSEQTDSITQLNQLIQRCPNKMLQEFVRNVFEDDSIAKSFYRLLASKDYHHDFQGGLLVHSVETANIAISALPESSADEVSLTLVAALFHDIGKIRTHDISGNRTSLGRVIGHETLTLECLARPLHKLENKWSDGATALRYLLTYTPEQIKRPLLPCAMAVSYADRLSASLSARRKAHKNQSSNSTFSYSTSKGPRTRFWNKNHVTKT